MNNVQMGSEMVEYEWEYLSEYGSIYRSMGVPFGVREYGSTGVSVEISKFHRKMHVSGSELPYFRTPVLRYSERYSRTPILIQRFNQLFAFPNTLNSFSSA